MEAEKKNGDKDGKALYKLISKAVYRNLRNKIHVGIVRNKKDYLEWTSKPSYICHRNVWQWSSRDT